MTENSNETMATVHPDSAGGARDTGSSLARMLQILDMITLERPSFTLEEISREAGYTSSTSYRYVRELSNAGLLAAVGGGRYALGPRIFELELLARRTDPVLRAAAPAVSELLAEIEEGIVLVCELRGSQAVYVHAEKTPRDSDMDPQRGTAMNLFRGSAAKAILAHLPSRRLTRLYAEFAPDIAAAGLGHDRAAFLKTIARMRRQPWILSMGEFDSRNFALSAPVFYGDGNVAGSINVIMRLKHHSEALVARLAPLLVAAAETINHRLEHAAATQPAHAPG